MKRFSQLTQTATETDFVAGNFFAIDVPGVGGATKKLPGECVAKRSIQDLTSSCVYNSYEDGSLSKTDGTVQPNILGYNRGVTDYIDVRKFSEIIVLRGSFPIASQDGCFACLYDENKSFVRPLYKGSIADFENELIDCSDVAYIRIVVKDTSVNTGVGVQFVDVLSPRNLYKCFAYADGYLKAEDGTINPNVSPSVHRGVTDYIDVSNFASVKLISGSFAINGERGCFACLYDKNKTFIGSIFSTPNNAVANMKVDCTAGYYLRFTIEDTTDSGCVIIELSPTDSAGLWSEFWKSEDGYLDYDDGSVNPNVSPSVHRGVTDYIDVSNFASVKLISGSFAINGERGCFACLYDKNKTFIRPIMGAPNTSIANVSFNCSDAYYMRVTITDTTAIPSSVAVSFKSVDNPYVYCKNYGKSVGVFGGSLSVAAESAAAKELWSKFLGLDVTSYGQGGAGFSSLNQYSIQTQVDGAATKQVYILWASTNDFTHDMEIGEYSDYTYLDNYDTSKLTTQCGGINYCIKKLFEKNLYAEVYFFTGIDFFLNESGYNPFTNITNNLGYTYQQYVDAQKKCCAFYSIPMLDQNIVCGFNKFNYTQYYTDNLHLNKEGYRKIAFAQIDFLKNGR